MNCRSTPRHSRRSGSAPDCGCCTRPSSTDSSTRQNCFLHRHSPNTTGQCPEYYPGDLSLIPGTFIHVKLSFKFLIFYATTSSDVRKPKDFSGSMIHYQRTTPDTCAANSGSAVCTVSQTTSRLMSK